MLWLPVREYRRELRIRDGFLVVVVFWVVLGLSGALPFLLLDEPAMPLADAVFEAVSGLTTTGATVLTGIDALPSRCCSTARCCNGWGAWGSSCSRSRFCPCSGSAGCSSIGRRRRVR